MSVHVQVLFLTLILSCSTFGLPNSIESHNENPPVSDNNCLAAGASGVDSPSVDNNRSSTLGCDPKGYSVEEGTEPGTHFVRITRAGTVVHTIRTPTGVEWNGFGFYGAKKTKQGFEISISYGSRFYYWKKFIFICRQHKFYLSKIRVDSLDKNYPESGKTKVVRVRPNVPLERFVITDFMKEGVVDP